MALILDADVQQYLAHAPVCLALVVVWNLWLQQFVAALCRHLQATHFLSQLYSQVCCQPSALHIEVFLQQSLPSSLQQKHSLQGSVCSKHHQLQCQPEP